MSKRGVKLGLDLAKDMRTVVGQVLGNNGPESKGGFPPTQPRQPRFYKSPSGGVAAPSNSTTPSSTACKLMKWNSGGTAFEETGITETVYSFSAYAADEIFQGKTVAGRIFADKAGVDTEIPAAPVVVSDTNSGTYFKKGITTTKRMSQILLQDTSSLWIDYWEATASGGTAGNMNIKLAGAYVVNLPFSVVVKGTKTTQVELDVVGGSNIFVYTGGQPSDVTIELWATEAGNTTWPSTSGDGVLLDKWINVESGVGLAIGGDDAQRSGVLSSMFESEVDDFELQIWHYEANNTNLADVYIVQRSGGYIWRLPNSIDTTFDDTDLGTATP